jgi:hypothetical protein
VPATNLTATPIADIFVANSVRLENDPEEGVEEQENSTVTYNVTYLETGLISLAASRDLIYFVECSHHHVGIQFKVTPSADQLHRMFPESALLVVDGEIFGSCDVGNQEITPFNLDGAGFLRVDLVQLDGPLVSVASYLPGLERVLLSPLSVFVPCALGSGVCVWSPWYL